MIIHPNKTKCTFSHRFVLIFRNRKNLFVPDFRCIEKNPTLCHPSLFESLEYWRALNTSHSIPRSRGLKLRKLVGTSFKSLFIPNLCSSHLTWQGPTANGAMLFTPNIAGANKHWHEVLNQNEVLRRFHRTLNTEHFSTRP